MSKKYLLGIITVLVACLLLGIYYFSKKPKTETGRESQCEVQEMIFYYLDQCKWCQKVKDEGTISKLEKLGVKVKKINAAIGPVRHKFEGVPTFVIKGEVHTGYQTLEELKEKLGCREK